ncbi:hypothetical protein [Breznakiella homolactica]|uniref:Uncharacterized protein n=1 Tax=Breznakiella homolactica TaxID=2798577 RepID=A0A7T7XPG4_9SPIR|nr:hypothetical protein [Breznakiella homolactica]QQO09973.1 hypothetical protein JFL75_03400 [Breznakiella homolactica]
MIRKFAGLAVLMILVSAGLYAADLSGISRQKPVHVGEVSVLVSSEVDRNNTGRAFLISFYYDGIEAIKAMVSEQQGLELDDVAFITEMENGNLDVSLDIEESPGQETMKRYTWRSAVPADLRASMTLHFGLREDGSLLLSVTVVNDDNSEEGPSELSFDMPLYLEG